MRLTPTTHLNPRSRILNPLRKCYHEIAMPERIFQIGKRRNKQFHPVQKPGPVRALLQEPLENGKVRCHLCAHRCVIHPGRVGVCSVRHNVQGVLYALNYRKTVALHIDPIEKKPLFHFMPGEPILSLAAPGCNFRCRFCQNSDISQMPLDYDRIEGEVLDPADIVNTAVERACKAIAFTYTEPTIFMEYAMEVGALAKERGLANVFVTNGYLTPEAVELVLPWLDAANIDLKGFDDRFYLQVCGARHAPVLETIKGLHKAGVWVEVTTLVIPGHNDRDEDLRPIAHFIASVSPDIPWHISAFHPDYEMRQTPRTPPETLLRAWDIGRAEGLRYVYVGNMPGLEYENTNCPKCEAMVIERHGFALTGWNMEDGACSACRTAIAGVGWPDESPVHDRRMGKWPVW